MVVLTGHCSIARNQPRGKSMQAQKVGWVLDISLRIRPSHLTTARSRAMCVHDKRHPEGGVMDSECETTNPEIRTRLAHRNGFLCVVAERGSPEGPDPTTLKVWYPIREAEEAEGQMLLGRPVIEVDPKEGIYVDEEGTVFQLAEKGETKPVLVEEFPNESGELEQLLA